MYKNNSGFIAKTKFSTFKLSPPNLLIWYLRMINLKTKYNDLARSKPASLSLSIALNAIY